MQINDDSYVELLAMLCRKGFGLTRIRRALTGTITTIVDEYDAEEQRIKAGKPTHGAFGCEPQDGKLAIFCVSEDGSKPWTMWREHDDDEETCACIGECLH